MKEPEMLHFKETTQADADETDFMWTSTEAQAQTDLKENVKEEVAR